MLHEGTPWDLKSDCCQPASLQSHCFHQRSCTYMDISFLYHSQILQDTECEQAFPPVSAGQDILTPDSAPLKVCLVQSSQDEVTSTLRRYHMTRERILDYSIADDAIEWTLWASAPPWWVCSLQAHRSSA